MWGAHATICSWTSEDSFETASFHLNGLWELAWVIKLFQQAPLFTGWVVFFYLELVGYLVQVITSFTSADSVRGNSTVKSLSSL